MTANQQLHVNVRTEDGSFWATVDEYPGVFATGDDLDELRASLEEGIALVMERKDGEPSSVTVAPLNLRPAARTVSTELVSA